MQRILIIISIVIIVTLIILGVSRSDYREKTFQETLNIKQKDITKLTMESSGVKKSTTDKTKIDILFKYFERVKYKRMRNDQTGHMPSKAHIIYLHTDNHIDFIVPYNDEAMISYKVYKIKQKKITSRFLTDFYHSLD